MALDCIKLKNYLSRTKGSELSWFIGKMAFEIFNGSLFFLHLCLLIYNFSG